MAGKQVKRRKSVVVGMLSVVMLLLAACGAPGGEEEVVVGQTDDAGTEAPATEATEGGATEQEATGDPIKIGFLAATTGTAASSGQDMVRGWDLYWKVNGDVAGGRQIQTVHEDTAGDPAVGLNKAKRLVENEEVKLVVGPLFANVGLAVADYMTTTGVPNFHPVASADDMTQRTRMDNVLRVGGWTSSQTSHPLGQYAYDEGYRKVVTICADYAFGHEMCGGFTNTFTDAGGEVIKQLWNPLGTQDFGTYMAQIQEQNPDAVFALQVGGDSVRYVESWSSFGMKDTIPLLGGEVLLDQSLLRNMGPEAEGLISSGKFAEGLDAPETQDFVESFDNEYGDLPSYYASVSYIAAQWTANALEEVDGDIEDVDAFLEAVRGLEFDSPGGPMKLDEYDNPDQNVYIREVQTREDGRMWNVPIKTYENVSQFWEYDPEEFLECPVYSREYQGKGEFPEGC
ncbi:MAG: ABC transporter substrate-binding protein [Nitriliruptorales bacterium]|nr:ABC transporter substrate-binding protein [Nitriliruptorales bacterium]